MSLMAGPMALLPKIQPMPGPRASFRLALALGLLLLGLFLPACALPVTVGAPPPTPVRVSQQAAKRLEVKLEQVIANPNPEFTLEITEEEATSYLALNVPQTTITDAWVRFQEGRIRLFGRLLQPLTIQVDTTWTAQVEQGQVRVKIYSATVACLPLPPSMLDSLAQTVNQMIAESQINVQITDIQILPGRLIISGVKR